MSGNENGEIPGGEEDQNLQAIPQINDDVMMEADYDVEDNIAAVEDVLANLEDNIAEAADNIANIADDIADVAENIANLAGNNLQEMIDAEHDGIENEEEDELFSSDEEDMDGLGFPFVFRANPQFNPMNINIPLNMFPTQRLDSDNDAESLEEVDDNVVNFDIELPGQHLYLDLPGDHYEDEIEEDEQQPLLPNQQNNQRQPDADSQQDEDRNRSIDNQHVPPVRNRTIRVPVLKYNPRYYNLTMMPSQKLPMRISNPHDRAVVVAANNMEEKSFICLDLRVKGPVFGTILKIESFNDNEECTTLLAEAKDRFKLIDVRAEITGVVIADIEILPDIIVYSPFSTIRLQSLCKHEPPTRTHQIRIENLMKMKKPVDETDCIKFEQQQDAWLKTKRKLRLYQSVLTPHPPWVMGQCDMHELADRVRPCLTSLVKDDDTEFKVPLTPIEVCRSACLNLPLTDTQKQKLIEMHACHQRLYYISHLFDSWQSLGCKECNESIARREDVTVISKDGLQSAYVNPGGFVHEMVTVKATTSQLKLIGNPTPQHSWFPGYAWVISNCPHCNHHLGWKFTAVQPNLRPKKFYGLTRNGVIPM